MKYNILLETYKEAMRGGKIVGNKSTGDYAFYCPDFGVKDDEGFVFWNHSYRGYMALKFSRFIPEGYVITTREDFCTEGVNMRHLDIKEFKHEKE